MDMVIPYGLLPKSDVPGWQIDGEKVEIASDFIFLGSKTNVDSDCSHKI